jgi:cell division GTPase FtsZ
VKRQKTRSPKDGFIHLLKKKKIVGMCGACGNNTVNRMKDGNYREKDFRSTRPRLSGYRIQVLCNE